MTIFRMLFAVSFICLAGNTFADQTKPDQAKPDQVKIGASLNEKEEIAVEDIPAGVLTAVKEIAPDMTINEAEKEYKHHNVYIDVEGILEDGREIEFDLLKQGDEWQVVEIQRDLQLEQVPENVVNTLLASSPTFEAKRIIESIQHGEDITIYEFYSVDSDGKEARKEVKLKNNKAEVLESEWSH